MPELPEVETIAQALGASEIIGSPIKEIAVFWEKTVGGDAKHFCKKMEGRRILSLSRRGKYLIFTLDAPYSLVVHLRMSGQFYLRTPAVKASIHEQVVFTLKNTSLHFHDPRKFGRMYLSDDLENFFAHLGGEPLSDSFTFEEFSKKLQKERAIKSLLLDQSVIAGIGNIYADEALWLSSVHPLQKASALTIERQQALWKAIPEVLKRGLAFRGTSLGTGKGNFHSVNGQAGEHQSYLQVFQRKAKPCFRCESLIQKIVVAQRGTHFCPSCQILK